jgi:hypothetical protein
MHIPADECDVGKIRDHGAAGGRIDVHGFADAGAPSIESRALTSIGRREPLDTRTRSAGARGGRSDNDGSPAYAPRESEEDDRETKNEDHGYNYPFMLA